MYVRKMERVKSWLVVPGEVRVFTLLPASTRRKLWGLIFVDPTCFNGNDNGPALLPRFERR